MEEVVKAITYSKRLRTIAVHCQLGQSGEPSHHRAFEVDLERGKDLTYRNEEA